MLRKEKGITLIALVITIIVMLILVIVTVNIAMNGELFNKAKNASINTERQTIYETIMGATWLNNDGTINVYETAERAKTALMGNGYKEEDIKIVYDNTSNPNVSTEATMTVTGKMGIKYSYLITETRITIKDNSGGDGGNQSTGEFDIRLDIYGRTDSYVEISMYSDLSNLFKGFASEAEAYAWLCNMVGVSENTSKKDLVEMMYSSSYEDLEAAYTETLGEVNEDDLLKMIFVGEDYKNYTLKEAIETVAAESGAYEPSKKTIKVNGNPVPEEDIEWDGADAIFKTTEFGNITVTVEFDDNIATGQINAIPSFGDFEYDLDDTKRTATVTGLSTTGKEKIQNEVTKLTMPNTVMFNNVEYTVTKIGRNAFYNKTNLDLNNLPSSLTVVEESAFEDCQNLSLTSLPDGITSIGSRAFSDCSKLELTNLPSNLINIGGSAFDHCLKFTSINWISNKTNITIGEYAFGGCIYLTSIDLPNGITSIGSRAFSDCGRLELESLPNGITNIGDRVFNACSKITQIEINSSNSLNVGSYIFVQCYDLTDIYLPNIQSKPNSWPDDWYQNCEATIHWGEAMP